MSRGLVIYNPVSGEIGSLDDATRFWAAGFAFDFSTTIRGRQAAAAPTELTSSTPAMEEGIFTSTGLRQISHRRDDIDEAIRLADWALILRAGKFVVDLRIDSAHPRDRNDSYSLEHRRMLLAELGVGLQA